MRRRRERGIGIGGLLKSIAKGQAKYKAGELHIVPNGYKFSDAGYTNPGGVHFEPRFTADGRRLASFSGKRTVTNCPVPPGDFPILQSDRGLRVYVPLQDCRKCQFHLKRERGRPFPCCSVLQENRKNDPSPMEEATAAYIAALNKAKEAIG